MHWTSAACIALMLALPVRAADGAITVTIQGIGAGLDGKFVTLIPLNGAGVPATVAADMGQAVRAWVCGGTGTTADLRYLPGTCRGL